MGRMLTEEKEGKSNIDDNIIRVTDKDQIQLKTELLIQLIITIGFL